MTWNRKKLEDDIEILFGKDQLKLLSPCLETIEEKEFYATYHLNEVERLINEELKKIALDNAKLTEISYDEDSKESKNAHLVIKKSGAHIIACLQSLHSLADVLAHVIYYALNMDNVAKTKMDTRRINAYSVLEKLDLVGNANLIKTNYDSLIKDDEFVYLSANVNRSKHRSIIKRKFWINMDPNKEYSANSLEFYKFEFNGKPHAQRRVVEFIKNEHSRIDTLVNEIGNEINKYVSNRLKLGKGSNKPS
jgi:hypothetical protein